MPDLGPFADLEDVQVAVHEVQKSDGDGAEDGVPDGAKDVDGAEDGELDADLQLPTIVASDGMQLFSRSNSVPHELGGRNDTTVESLL